MFLTLVSGIVKPWDCETLFAYYYVRDSVFVQKRLKVLLVRRTHEAMKESCISVQVPV